MSSLRRGRCLIQRQICRRKRDRHKKQGKQRRKRRRRVLREGRTAAAHPRSTLNSTTPGQRASTTKMGPWVSKHSTQSKPSTAPRRTGLFCKRPEEPQGALFIKVSRLGDDGTEKSGNLRNCAFVVQEDVNVNSFILYSIHRGQGRSTLITRQT